MSWSKVILKGLVWGLLLGCGQPSGSDLSEQINPYQEIGLRLGYGWDTFLKKPTKAYCIDPGPQVYHDKLALKKAAFKGDLSALEVEEMLDFKAKINLSAKQVGVEAGGGYAQHHASDELSATVSFFSETTWGRFSTLPPRGKSGFRAGEAFLGLVAEIENRHQDTFAIREACGNEWIHAQDYGAKLLGTLKFSFHSKADKNRFFAELGVSSSELARKARVGSFGVHLDFSKLSEQTLESMGMSTTLLYQGPMNRAVAQAFTKAVTLSCHTSSVHLNSNAPYHVSYQMLEGRANELKSCVDDYFLAIAKLDEESYAAFAKDRELQKKGFRQGLVPTHEVPLYLATRFYTEPYEAYATNPGLEAFRVERYFGSKDVRFVEDHYQKNQGALNWLIKELKQNAAIAVASEEKLSQLGQKLPRTGMMEAYMDQLKKVIDQASLNHGLFLKTITACMRQKGGGKACSLSEFTKQKGYQALTMDDLKQQLSKGDLNFQGLLALAYLGVDVPKNLEDMPSVGQMQTMRVPKVQLESLPLSGFDDYAVVYKGELIGTKAGWQSLRIQVAGGRHLLKLDGQVVSVGGVVPKAGIGAPYETTLSYLFTPFVAYDFELIFFKDEGPLKLELFWEETEGLEPVREYQPYGLAAAGQVRFHPDDFLAYRGRHVYGGGVGVEAQYYDDEHFERPVYRRLLPTVDEFWRGGVDRIGDEFSVRYTGLIAPPDLGKYTFILTIDDGALLRIGGQEVINAYHHKKSAHEVRGEFEFKDHQALPIEVLYRNLGKEGQVRLEWAKSEGGLATARRMVPKEALYPR